MGILLCYIIAPTHSFEFDHSVFEGLVGGTGVEGLYFSFGVVGVGRGMEERGRWLVEGDEDLVVDDFGGGEGVDHGNKKYYGDKGCCYYF